MARSRRRSSCFKMITCGGGGDSVNNDDVEPDEGKGSVDRRGWSFRKRSTRHRVLSNTIVSEVSSSLTKESPEASSIDFHAQNNPVPKKMSMSQWMEDMPPLSSSVNSKIENLLITKETAAKNDPIVATETASKIDPLVSTETASKIDPLVSTETASKIDPLVSTETASKIDPLVYTEAAGKIDPLVSTETATENIDCTITSENKNGISQNLIESSAVVIQAAIRGYMAHRGLLKLKNIVKLQAAFRGHLERRQALGTLRCVQAIVKMQALVRARRARLALRESAPEEKVGSKHEEKSRSHVILGKEPLGSKANINFTSTQKFLSNGFARQLLESAPKKKRIHIKCDPSKPDSAWKWLERWVSVSPPDSAQAQTPGSSPRHQERGEKTAKLYEVETGAPAACAPISLDLEQNVTQEPSAAEDEENLITYDADNFKFQASHPSSSARKVTPKPHCDVDSRQAQNTSSIDDASQMEMHVGATSQTLPVSVSNKPDVTSEQPRRSVKRMASEQPETEGKKFGFGSRKAMNPAFAAVQSKFEELSSSPISGRSNSSSQVAVESKFDGFASTAESGKQKPEHNLAETSFSHEPVVRVGDSDCGTELSISSTLDSPDRSEVGGVQFEHEVENAEKLSEPQETTDNDYVLQNLDVLKQGKPDDVRGGESVVAALPVSTPPLELQPERMQTEQQPYMLSPEGSLKSHMTVPESHGTPSSQVSVNAKRNKLDKSGSSKTRKSLSAGKRSPSNPNHDSGARSSTEQLPRYSQNGKRRNSFGSPRPDQVDQEPRESSSNSLPSYMQATESARAKALANSSPRSSPDVLDKDISLKKRHSLPGANGKQVSPRLQRSTSQVQQGGKGNTAHTQDRKWQR